VEIMSISYLMFFMSDAIPFVLLYNPLTIVHYPFTGRSPTPRQQDVLLLVSSLLLSFFTINQNNSSFSLNGVFFKNSRELHFNN